MSVPDSTRAEASPIRDANRRLRRTLYAGGLIVLSVCLALVPLPWSKWGTFGLISLFMVTFACGMMAFLPSPAYGVIFSAARGYGFLPATIIGGLGWSTGEMILFHAGRHIPQEFADWMDRNGPKLVRLLRSPAKGFVLTFLVTLIPNPLFDVVSILAARIGIRSSRYFIPMAAARVLRSALIAWVALASRG